MPEPIHLLAIGAHPDDVELTCGGTLIKAARQGHRTGIIDLTRGETASQGTPQTRQAEAAEAARVMGVAERVNAGLPDAHLHNTDETRTAAVELLRLTSPPWVSGNKQSARVFAFSPPGP